MRKTSPVILLTAAFALAGWGLGVPRRVFPAASSGNAPVSPPLPLPGTAVPTAKIPAQPQTGTLPGPGRLDPIGLRGLRFEEYPARLRQALAEGWEDQKKWLAERWAERDPASLLAFMLAPEGLNFMPGTTWPDHTITQACFGSWFRKNPAAAQAAMEKLARFNGDDGAMNYGAWVVILPKLMEVDQTRALRFLADHPEFRFNGALIGEYPGLAEAVRSMPEGGSRESLLMQMFQKFTNASDREQGMAEGLAWLGKLSPSARLEALPWLQDLDAKELPRMREMLGQAFTEEDLTALENELKTGKDPRKLQVLASLRALRDPKAAMAWAETNLTGKARIEALGNMLAGSVPGTLAEGMAFVDSFPAGPLRDRALSTVIQQGGETGDRKATGDWVLTLPDAKDVKAGISRLMRGGWAEYQAPECAAWLSGLPPDSRRSEAAAAALSGVRDPVKKMNFAASLPPDLGAAALDQAFRNGGSSSDSRPLAEAAALQPAGAIRELGMARASRDARYFFNGFTQSWLDWAATLPTAADRAAALKGAEELGNRTNWGDGVREAAKTRLGGS